MVDNIENKLQGDYYTKRFINIKKYLTEEYNDILKKLNINIEDKNYTYFEFAQINSKVVTTRKNTKLLETMNIDSSKYLELLNIFDKIENDYNL